MILSILSPRMKQPSSSMDFKAAHRGQLSLSLFSPPPGLSCEIDADFGLIA